MILLPLLILWLSNTRSCGVALRTAKAAFVVVGSAANPASRTDRAERTSARTVHPHDRVRYSRFSWCLGTTIGLLVATAPTGSLDRWTTSPFDGGGSAAFADVPGQSLPWKNDGASDADGSESRSPMRLESVLMREGTTIPATAGVFQLSARRWAFQSTGETSRPPLRVLVTENLMLQRIVEAIRADDSDNRWIITGEVSEFFGENRLRIRTAQRASQRE